MRLSFARVAAILLAFTFAIPAFAETPREELVHSWVLLKLANNDYGGHRVVALREVEAAGRELGLALRGEGSARERQYKSDQHLIEARKLLVHAREKLEVRDRDRVAARVEKAIKEIDASLAMAAPVPPPAPAVRIETPAIVVPSVRVETPTVRIETPGRVETPREELVHAYFRMKFADHDYAGHRAVAMKEVEIAGKELGLNLKGEGPGGERQFKSDEHMAEARRLLRHAREKLEARDRDRVAAHVDKAIGEIDAALRVR